MYNMNDSQNKKQPAPEMGFYDKGLHDAFREYVELVDSFPNI
jgi:hypothetical protein